jgi:hypothetical protein
MTIVVSVRVNDGIVLASDSATSFTEPSGVVVKVYNHADKIFNLVKGLSIGAMTYGNGAIGFASISTISKDLRRRFSDVEDREFFIDKNNYTIEQTAIRIRDYMMGLYQAAYTEPNANYFMGYRVCGYSSNSDLPEAWEIGIAGDQAFGPNALYDASSFGPRWAGETEALDRLIMGMGTKFPQYLINQGASNEEAQSFYVNVIKALSVPLSLPAMPIQDAIDLAKFLAETAAKFTHFSLRSPTVGGAIELATITKHEGFKWVNRKHYYTTALNPEIKT